MAKYKLSKGELIEQWNDQVNFLSSSCKLFDEGNEKEAKRLAVDIRILFHQSANSKSLYNQLNLPLSFYSSGGQYSPNNLLTSWTLLTMKMDSNGISYEATFDMPGRHFMMNFDDWWHEVIFDDKHRCFTRRDIVLFVANKDGGAHVDPELNESFSRLVKYNSLGWVDGFGKAPNNNPLYQAIRVIATEIFTSITLMNDGIKSRKKINENQIEMRYIDEKRSKRYVAESINITYSESLSDIYKKHSKESRSLYLQEYSSGLKIEYLG